MLRSAARHRTNLLSLLRRRLPSSYPLTIHSSPNPTNNAFNVSSQNNPFLVSSSLPAEFRRCYAKPRRSYEDDGGDDVGQVTENIGLSVKSTAVSQMEAAIDALSRELAKLRTGRANPGMLDHIIVETGGLKMSLNHLAVVSVIDSKTLSITPYDPNTLKELEKAIVSSPLGLNPKADGERLIAVVPALTKEHVQAVCKIVSKSSEVVKQSIRRARQKALDTMKKAVSSIPKDKDKAKKKEKSEAGVAGPSFSKDEAKRLEKEIEDLTKKFIKSAEDMCKAKEKEIAQG